MALIQCPECSKDVSDKATNCIHCGNPLKQAAPAAAYATPVPAAPKKKMGVIGKIGSWILAFFVAMAIIGAFSDNKSSTPTNSASSTDGAGSSQATGEPTQTDAPEFSTTAEELANAYAQNTVAADNKFKDHRFSISGRVANINTDITDSAVIDLVNPADEFSQPQAVLADSNKQTAASLMKGQKINLTCTGNGDVIKTPMLKNCTIN